MDPHRPEVPVEDGDGLVVARLDVDRLKRCGAPEAVFAQGKTPEETLRISEVLAEKQGFALITRAGPEAMQLISARWPDCRRAPHAGAALVGTPPEPARDGRWAAVIAAGTSDLPVAEEAVLTLAALGREGRIIADVGVAGLQRLLDRLEDIRAASVVIAVAGMEGALPSVVAGLIASPVVAVPTSVGYGVHLGGITALLGMLGSCAPGISVVNIDNGFGAAMTAARIMNV
ncbi:MAG: nickel pincer cofactor biosynthesis protein LarB [Planctomycetaceae bacterium]|nr:nickel pincer cofactor biosynthesis protein LarB [Planctomycetaceae bacterium]